MCGNEHTMALNVHLYLLIVFTFSYLWTDVKDCMKFTQVFTDLLVVINQCPSQYWVKKILDKPESQFRSPESEVWVQSLSPRSNFLDKGWYNFNGTGIGIWVWQIRGQWLDLRRVIKICEIFHNSVHQRALRGQSESN